MELLKSICSDVATPSTVRVLLKKTEVNSATGCWEWTGTRDAHGYGQLSTLWFKNGTSGISRNSWIAFHGPIPNGLRVLHRCDNPPCWNPSHLFLGTAKDNMDDMVAKGRHYQQQKTHCIRGHEYTAENTYLYEDGSRRCRTCYCKDPVRHLTWGTHCKNGHEYTPESTYPAPPGRKYPRCKVCAQQQGRASYLRRTRGTR